jgi:hypothetical protein
MSRTAKVQRVVDRLFAHPASVRACARILSDREWIGPINKATSEAFLIAAQILFESGLDAHVENKKDLLENCDAEHNKTY